MRPSSEGEFIFTSLRNVPLLSTSALRSRTKSISNTSSRNLTIYMEALGEQTKCPTCDDDSFDTVGAMRIHHTKAHGESLITETSVCEQCGDEFEYLPKDSEGRFCGSECWYEHGQDEEINKKRRETMDEYWSSNQEEHLDSMVEGEDHPFFGEELSEAHKESISKARRGKLTGSDHPRWSGKGGVPFGYNWEEQREKALKRDGYECQYCGMTNSEHNEKYDEGMTVHHIIPRKEFFDRGNRTFDTEEANKLENLMALCVKHNAQADHGDLEVTYD